MAVYDLEEQEQARRPQGLVVALWQVCRRGAVGHCGRVAREHRLALVRAESVGAGKRAVSGGEPGCARQRCGESQGAGHADRGSVRWHGLRAARGDDLREAALRRRRSRGHASAVAVGYRSLQRGRAQGHRPLPPARNRCSTKSSTTRRLARSTPRPTRPSPASSPTSAATSLLPRASRRTPRRPTSSRSPRSIRSRRIADSSRSSSTRWEARSDEIVSPRGPCRACVLLGGCETMSSWIPSIPVPSLSWLGIGRSAKKPGPLPATSSQSTARVDWQVAHRAAKAVSASRPRCARTSFTPRAPTARSSASTPSTGKQNWRITADTQLVGRRRGRAEQRRRRHRQGRRVRVRPQRQAASGRPRFPAKSRGHPPMPKASSSSGRSTARSSGSPKPTACASGSISARSRR